MRDINQSELPCASLRQNTGSNKQDQINMNASEIEEMQEEHRAMLIRHKLQIDNLAPNDMTTENELDELQFDLWVKIQDLIDENDCLENGDPRECA